MDRRRLRGIESALWRWMDLARRRRRITLALWIALAAAGGWLASVQLKVNSDSAGLIAAHLPYQKAKRAFDAAFPDARNQVLVLVQAATPDAADIAAGALVRRLEARPDIARHVFAPAFDPFFVQNGLLYLDEAALARLMGKLTRAAPMIERLALEPSLTSLFAVLADAAEEIEERGAALDRDALIAVFTALSDLIEPDQALGAAATTAAQSVAPLTPLSWKALFLEDPGPTVRLIAVAPVLDFSRLRPADPVVDAIRAEAAQVRAQTAIAAMIHITGDPVLRADELRSVSEGMERALVVSGVLVTALLLVAFRSVALALATLAVVTVSILITAGFAALVLGALNMISVAFAVLMLGLGVDFAVHLALHAQHDRGRGLSLRAALYRTARNIGAPLALAAPTTALAFLAFSPTPFVGMAQLGVLGAFGVLTAFLAASSMVPAIMALQGAPSAVRAAQQGAGRPASEARWRFWAAWIMVGLAVPAALMATQARFDADPMALRDPLSASVQAFNAVLALPGATPYRLSVLAPAGEAAQARARALEADPAVDEALTLADFVPRNQNAKRTLVEAAAIGLSFALFPDPAFVIVEPTRYDDALARLRAGVATLVGSDDVGPAARRFAAALDRLADAEAQEIAAVEQAVFAHWPAQLARMRAQIAPQTVTLEALPEAVTTRFVAPDGRWRIDVSPAEDVREPADRRRFVDAVLTLEPDASGAARTIFGAAQAVSGAMVQAVLTAAVLVALMVWLALRHARLTALILAPLGLAGVLAAATSAALGVPFNYANVIVIPLLIGVGVDSGIHLAMRAHAVGAAVHDTTTPRAVFFSALTTIASFASLMASPHGGIASMGALLTIAIGWTLACTIIALPVLMQTFGPSRSSRLGSMPAPHSSGSSGADTPSLSESVPEPPAAAPSRSAP